MQQGGLQKQEKRMVEICLCMKCGRHEARQEFGMRIKYLDRHVF